jgi:hypothetical protein
MKWTRLFYKNCYIGIQYDFDHFNPKLLFITLLKEHLLTFFEAFVGIVIVKLLRWRALFQWMKRSLSPEKIDRLKEDQAFSLSLELGRRENFLRHPSADLLPTQPQ